MMFFDLQGHRGCRALMPENTIPAMTHALELGVNTLEMDVVITADEEVILSHEPFFSHLISTDPEGIPVSREKEKELNIFRMTLEEVQAFDVGMKPHPGFPLQKKIAASKPTLRSVIDSAESYAKKQKRPLAFYNIETKCRPETDNLYHPPPERFTELLVNVIREKEITERTFIQSFDYRVLRYLHRNYPEIKTVMLVDEHEKKDIATLIKELGFKPSVYSPHYRLVNEKLIKYCKDEGIRIIPWTVNDAGEFLRLKEAGVDGIITDDPSVV